MAKDALKEAIAEAKTLRETAIANAKLALEEAFTPKIQSMLSDKLNEMEKAGITHPDVEKIRALLTQDK